MSMTTEQATTELRRFTRKRTDTVQELAKVGPPDLISGDLVHGHVSKEVNHRNIVGGAVKVDGEWVASGTDRGLAQLNEEVHEDYLRSVWGCDSGTYTPKYPPAPRGQGAFPRGRVPGLTRGIERMISIMQGNVIRCWERDVPWDDALFVALCGYNRGIDTAINAYRHGGRWEAEAGTATGDYATDILRRRGLFRRARKRLGWSVVGQFDH